MSVQVSSEEPYMAQPSLKQCLIILQTPAVIQRDLWSLLALSLLSVLITYTHLRPLRRRIQRPKLWFMWKGAETQRHKRQSKLSLCLTDVELSCQPPFPCIDSRLFFTACMNHSLQCMSATSTHNVKNRLPSQRLDKSKQHFFYNG